MQRYLPNIRQILIAHQKTVIATMIALFIVIISAACFWKYAYYQYNGIDLAYFNQVFWNTVQGKFFVQTIHPHLSLGDHAELIIPVLAILYAPFRDPRALLVLQSLALALAVIPLWLIAKRKFAAHSLAPLFIATLWLINPFIQNIALYEFHILAFAPLPIFFAVLEYEKERRGRFLLWTTIALLVREDVALVIAAISLLAWCEKKSWFWKIVPLVLATIWFVMAMNIISAFAPAGNYKFLIYYSWLGATPATMIIALFTQPLLIIKKIVTLPNIEMLLGFGIPLLFLPLKKPVRLLLMVGPLLQILLGAPGGGELILRTHYATLFLPGIFLAATDGLAGIRWRPRLIHGLVAVGALYGMFILGPLPSITQKIIFPGPLREQKKVADQMLKKIPQTASVASSYALLPNFSSRDNLYSLHYLFLGVNQFATSPYPVPKNLQYLAIDTTDFLFYQAQFPSTAWAAPYAKDGYSRLQSLGGTEVFSQGMYQLIDRTDPNTSPSPAIKELPPTATTIKAWLILNNYGTIERRVSQNVPLKP